MSKNVQALVILAAGLELNFTVDRDKFNKYTNEISTENKVAPSHNFLVRCVNSESKDDLLKIIDENPGSEIELANVLASDYKPDIGAVVKERTSKPSA
ncbi:putative phage tail assembly chaperone [Bowmanella denitrificans]|uniref:putative phage tail assembly chaperone n=1 Tax=Bowmanella denitrificans TaxID=366582 RepID=UPI000C9AC1C6|nr:putative phage tail assembly chaperone [Bowmanella denitrificans]